MQRNKGAAEMMDVAAEYVTANAVDDEVVIITLEPTGDGKLHKGTGIEGENFAHFFSHWAESLAKYSLTHRNLSSDQS